MEALKREAETKCLMADRMYFGLGEKCDKAAALKLYEESY